MSNIISIIFTPVTFPGKCIQIPPDATLGFRLMAQKFTLHCTSIPCQPASYWGLHSNFQAIVPIDNNDATTTIDPTIDWYDRQRSGRSNLATNNNPFPRNKKQAKKAFPVFISNHPGVEFNSDAFFTMMQQWTARPQNKQHFSGEKLRKSERKKKRKSSLLFCTMLSALSQLDACIVRALFCSVYVNKLLMPSHSLWEGRLVFRLGQMMQNNSCSVQLDTIRDKQHNRAFWVLGLLKVARRYN